MGPLPELCWGEEASPSIIGRKTPLRMHILLLLGDKSLCFRCFILKHAQFIHCRAVAWATSLNGPNCSARSSTKIQLKLYRFIKTWQLAWLITYIWLQDFIDLTLSKTQRKTPTVIHKHYQIHRIRQFYMRKVKYTQQNYHDRLTQILTDFPKLDVSICLFDHKEGISGIRNYSARVVLLELILAWAAQCWFPAWKI